MDPQGRSIGSAAGGIAAIDEFDKIGQGGPKRHARSDGTADDQRREGRHHRQVPGEHEHTRGGEPEVLEVRQL